MVINKTNAVGEITTSDNTKLDSVVNVLDTSQVHKILGMITSIYTNPILACLREVATNAYDAHVEKGNTYDPILVAIYPDGIKDDYYNRYDKYKLLIQDKGYGMDKDFMMNKFSNFLFSTKDHSDLFTGGFGIGSKAPLGYTDSCLYICVTDDENGKRYKRTWLLSKDGGSSATTLLFEEETTEDTGVTVEVIIKGNDIESFVEHALQLIAIPNVYFDGELTFLNNIKVEENENYFIFCVSEIYNGRGSEFARNKRYLLDLLKSRLVLGKNFYPIPDKDTIYKYIKYFNDVNLSKCIVPRFEVGDLKITQTRESIKIDSSTDLKIVEVFNTINDKIKDQVIQEFSTINTFGDLYYALLSKGLGDNIDFYMESVEMFETPLNILVDNLVNKYPSIGVRGYISSPKRIIELCYNKLKLYSINGKRINLSINSGYRYDIGYITKVAHVDKVAYAKKEEKGPFTSKLKQLKALTGTQAIYVFLDDIDLEDDTLSQTNVNTLNFLRDIVSLMFHTKSIIQLDDIKSIHSCKSEIAGYKINDLKFDDRQIKFTTASIDLNYSYVIKKGFFYFYAGNKRSEIYPNRQFYDKIQDYISSKLIKNYREIKGFYPIYGVKSLRGYLKLKQMNLPQLIDIDDIITEKEEKVFNNTFAVIFSRFLNLLIKSTKEVDKNAIYDDEVYMELLKRHKEFAPYMVRSHYISSINSYVLGISGLTLNEVDREIKKIIKDKTKRDELKEAISLANHLIGYPKEVIRAKSKFGLYLYDKMNRPQSLKLGIKYIYSNPDVKKQRALEVYKAKEKVNLINQTIKSFFA